MAARSPLFEESLLRRNWTAEYGRFSASERSTELLERLRRWSGRANLTETQLEAQFIRLFFVETWGYQGAGVSPDGRYTYLQQQGVAGAGQRGGMGSADLALGHYGPGADGVNQVLCEFKDTRSGLDTRQNRPGARKTPVEQGLDYLNCEYQNRNREARVYPAWAVITDMNEFRLYHRRGPTQFQRFVITATTVEDREFSLLPPADADESAREACAFRRFVFEKLFSAAMLLASVDESEAECLMHRQDIIEKEIEESFYTDYKEYRIALYQAIIDSNPGYRGTRGRLVRLTQRLLDRFIFLLYCEDMGDRLDFPADQLRYILTEYAGHRYYNSESQEPWYNLKALFTRMRNGGEFDGHRINRFNGGLFEEDAELESLNVPARVFCAQNQGAPGAIVADRKTLLYFSASYNFGIRSDNHQKTIGLTTLGRIFEQSITELEMMEARADGRVSLNELGRRKTDGVYYTPEWVTSAIVDEAVGGRLEDLRNELGYAELPELGDEDILAYRSFLADRRRTAPVAGEWISYLDSYRFRLGNIKIVDPACGSGAFLIQALEKLVTEYRAVIEQKQMITGRQDIFDRDEVVRSILSQNLFGVDINPESVEITQLALWLHTASPGSPLCSLDNNIKCGNSLVGGDFYDDEQYNLLGPEERERVNTFDWERAFPNIMNGGGFDCVIGNPPYIKYQNLVAVHPGVAEYLRSKTRDDGTPLYISARVGNFDIYLAFIEKGLDLLRPQGRMGFIAPNLWLVNEYGLGLRSLLARSRQLDRWVDFKSFQVFRDAITYTALQFFRKEPRDRVECLFAPDGPPTILDWSRADRVSYDVLQGNETWNFMPEAELRLIGRLRQSCLRLDDPTLSQSIFQGIITSSDAVYHLQRLGEGLYRTRNGQEVELEDTIMRPLLSGVETKRYQEPKTDTYLLFPYTPEGRLFTQEELRTTPRARDYLLNNEDVLRGREHGRFDDDSWYRYGRNQNIAKQNLAKLCVAETVPSLRVTVDARGDFCINNVRVNGILARNENSMFFLLGILNAPVCDFVFRRTAKPKSGGYFEANRQFIVPLPIPNVTEQQKLFVADQARALLDLHSRCKTVLKALSDRLHSGQVRAVVHSPDWMWADVRTVNNWRADAPEGLSRPEITAWARSKYNDQLSHHVNDIDALIAVRDRSSFHVSSNEGRLTLRINGRVAVDLFDKPHPDFIAAQWRHALRGFNGDAGGLLKKLLSLCETDDDDFRGGVIRQDAEMTALGEQIAHAERTMNNFVFDLYGLSEEERRLVEADYTIGEVDG